MKKRIITFILLVVMMTTFLVPTVALAGPPTTTKFTTGLASDTGYFLEVYNGGWTNLKTPKHWGTASATTALCLDHGKEGPSGSENYVRFSASSAYSTSTINGIYAILENGYPSNSHGMTGNEVKTATANALRIWLRESAGIGHSYMTTSNIRAKSGYSDVYNVMCDLVNKARNADSNYMPSSASSITTSPSVVELDLNSAGTALTATFTVTNPTGDLEVDTSKLPSGVTISGSGTTKTITAPLGTDDMTITNLFKGKSNITSSNIYFYKPSYGSTYQPLVVWDYGTYHTLVYGDLAIKGQSGGYISITKKDEDTGVKLSGAVFDVLNSSNSIVDIITTNSNGIATSELLPNGTYKIREKTAPNGYVLDTTVVGNITVTTNNTANTNVTNQAQMGVIKVIKTDSETGSNPQGDASLDGASFVVMDSSNNVVQTLNATEKQITSDKLPLGTYKVKEVTPPTGYNLNPTVYTVNITAPSQNIGIKTVTQTVTDEVIKGDIKIIKTGDYSLDGQTQDVLLTGVGFEIRLKSSGELVDTIFTDDNGTAVAENLPYGTYVITEINTPNGYMACDDFDVIVDTQDKEVIVSVENEAILVSVSIIKKDVDTGTPILIAGTQFQIRDSEDNLILDNGNDIFTTDATGQVTLSSPLTSGNYTLHETTPPYGYYLDSTPISFSIDENTSDTLMVEHSNKIVEKQIRVIKADARDITRRLSGAAFEIYNSDGNTVDKITTGSDGTAISKMLVYGDYTVKEVSPPVGFKVESDTQEVTIDDSKNDVYEIEFQNYPTEITIVKHGSDTNEPLGNTEIKVFNTNGDSVYTGTTDADGEFGIVEIPQGDYTFEEVVAPIGYTLSTSTYTFSIDDNGAETEKISFANDPTTVTLTKLDELTDTPLSGTEFEVYNEDAELVFSGATGDDGTITITHLPIGIYTVREVKAPNGYVLNPHVIEFTIDEYGEISGETTLTNCPTTLNIFKVDYENNTPLTGAGFKVKNLLGLNVLTFTKDSDDAYWYDKDGGLTEVMVDADGKAIVHGLPFGNYWLEESTVPDGYYPTAPVKVTIRESNDIDIPCESTIANSKYVKLGLDRERWLYPLYAVLIVSATTGLFFYFRKKRRTN